MNGFRFKQFTVYHDRCAMKVNTDSIVLGCYAPVQQVNSVLDIGTGSGLLALMLAQRTAENTRIVGVDIDSDAIEQAKINASLCPWVNKLEFLNADIRYWHTPGVFDLVISNPPYFAPKPGQLSRQDANYIEEKRRLARHTLSLGYRELLEAAKKHLSDTGMFFCVLPANTSPQDKHKSEHPLLGLAAEIGLYCHHFVSIIPNPNKPANRVVLGFGLSPASCHRGELTIRNADNHYTPDYQNLCKAFYLKF